MLHRLPNNILFIFC
jgi:hypothetical protein